MKPQRAYFNPTQPNALERKFRGDQKEIVRFLTGKSIGQVAVAVGLSEERVRTLFRRYGVDPVKRCPRCGTTEDLTSNSICRPCRGLDARKEDYTKVLEFTKKRLPWMAESLNGYKGQHVLQSEG